jgi:hypothetical protein
MSFVALELDLLFGIPHNNLSILTGQIMPCYLSLSRFNRIVLRALVLGKAILF